MMTAVKKAKTKTNKKPDIRKKNKYSKNNNANTIDSKQLLTLE